MGGMKPPCNCNGGVVWWWSGGCSKVSGLTGAGDTSALLWREDGMIMQRVHGNGTSLALRTWNHDWKEVGMVDGAVDSGRGGGSCGMVPTASSSTAIARWKQ